MMQEMNLAAISIELGIAVLMAAVLLIDLCMARGTSRRALARVTALGLLGVLALAVRMYPPDGGATAFFAGLYIVDGYAVFFKILFIVGVLATVLFAEDYVEKMIRHRGEFYLLLLSALLGMCTLVLYARCDPHGCAALGRGRHQVSGVRVGLDGSAPLRHEPRLRDDGDNDVSRDRTGTWPRAFPRAHRRGLYPRGLLLQTLDHPVPSLGTRCI